MWYYEDYISTHVPRAGDDGQYFTNEYRNPNFNPRPPCGRRPLSPEDDTIGDSAFQPTSPVRETTKSNGKARQHFYDFNPRPPCGRRQHNGRLHMTEIIFQPTSPVRETTSSSSASTYCNLANFNPRPPCGRRPYSRSAKTAAGHFNPRPPCGRRRPQTDRHQHRQTYFNPRPPCGRRPTLADTVR